MKCAGCQSNSATELRVIYAGKKKIETCDQCGGFARSWNPDVYFEKPYFDQHIADPNDPKTSRGQWIVSKVHKATLMKKLKMREAGDRIHGERTEYRPYGPSKKGFFYAR